MFSAWSTRAVSRGNRAGGVHQEEVQDGVHPQWVLEPPHLQAAHQPEEVGNGGEHSP